MAQRENREAQDSPDANIKKIGELIKDIDFAMLTTVNEEGYLHSRPMSTQTVDFDGTVWFFTYEDSPKVSDIRRNPSVNVAYAAPGKQNYVSLSGTAQIVKDRAKIEELWESPLRAWFPQGADTPGIALIQVTAHSAEFWDSPSNPISHLISLAKVAVTGKPANVGENVAFDLDNEEEEEPVRAGSGI